MGRCATRMELQDHVEAVRKFEPADASPKLNHPGHDPAIDDRVRIVKAFREGTITLIRQCCIAANPGDTT
jgi:hypothetical protein